MSAPDAEVVRARAYLSRVAEPPAAALAAYVDRLGPVEAAERIRRGAVPDVVRSATGARRTVDRVDADLEAAAAVGARLLVPEDADWPRWAFAAYPAAGTRELGAPLALWVKGPLRLGEVAERAVAIVGARAATGYGVHIASDRAGGLAAAGATVVSGAAFGIDAAAHRGSLASEGPTLAVLACGIDRAYPAAHTELLDRVAATGLVVSEYPPGAVPARHRFLVRNRPIAGIGAGTVVVEAGAGGGAPAPPPRPPAPPPPPPARGQAAVHDALPSRAARDARWLAMEAGLPLDTVRTGLLDLERLGMAEYRDGLWQRSLPSR